MAAISAILSALAGVFVINLIRSRKEDHHRSSDLDHFAVGCGRPVFRLGCVLEGLGAGLFAMIELGAYFSDQELPLELAVLLAIVLFVPGISLLACTIPGFWAVCVDQDDVAIKKLFRIRERWKIHEIERCEMAVSDEMRVYVKGCRKKAFAVSAMLDNYETFVDRMRAERVPIINRRKAGD